MRHWRMFSFMDGMLLFLTKLKGFLEEERGRKAALARRIGIGPQNISAWCRLESRHFPDGRNVLLVIGWLQETGEDITEYLPHKVKTSAVEQRKRRGGGKRGGEKNKLQKPRGATEPIYFSSVGQDWLPGS